MEGFNVGGGYLEGGHISQHDKVAATDRAGDLGEAQADHGQLTADHRQPHAVRDFPLFISAFQFLR